MNVSQLLMQSLPPAIPFNASPAEQFIIPTASDGWTLLSHYLDREINLKSRGQSTSPFTLFQLIELQRLIPSQLENTLITAEQKHMLIDCACLQWMYAYDLQLPAIIYAYDTLLDELIEQATAIRFVL